MEKFFKEYLNLKSDLHSWKTNQGQNDLHVNLSWCWCKWESSYKISKLV